MQLHKHGMKIKYALHGTATDEHEHINTPTTLLAAKCMFSFHDETKWVLCVCALC